LLTGYLLIRTRRAFRMKIKFVIMGWVVSILTLLFVVSLFYGFYGLQQNKNIAGTLYVILGRTAWGLANAWIVVACVTGYGGWFNTLLSWKLWVPFARLTYAAYLFHPMIIRIVYANAVTPTHVSFVLIACFYIGNLVLSYGVAFIVYMTLETPTRQLEKLIFKNSSS